MFSEPVWRRGRVDHPSQRVLQELLHEYLRRNHLRVQGPAYGKWIVYNVNVVGFLCFLVFFINPPLHIFFLSSSASFLFSSLFVKIKPYHHKSFYLPLYMNPALSLTFTLSVYWLVQQFLLYHSPRVVLQTD